MNSHQMNLPIYMNIHYQSPLPNFYSMKKLTCQAVHTFVLCWLLIKYKNTLRYLGIITCPYTLEKHLEVNLVTWLHTVTHTRLCNDPYFEPYSPSLIRFDQSHYSQGNFSVLKYINIHVILQNYERYDCVMFLSQLHWLLIFFTPNPSTMRMSVFW